jgi:hypothetical protein
MEDSMKEKSTPYDTGKVKIGVYYQPPKFPLEEHELLLQNLLLADREFIDTPPPWYKNAVIWGTTILGLSVYLVLIGSL